MADHRLRLTSAEIAAAGRRAMRSLAERPPTPTDESLLLVYADRIEKARPYLKNGMFEKWCRDIVADMRADAEKVPR